MAEASMQTENLRLSLSKYSQFMTAFIVFEDTEGTVLGTVILTKPNINATYHYLGFTVRNMFIGATLRK
jgi:hypothetical protein